MTGGRRGNFSFPGGQEESEGQPQRGSLQPHEVPPLYGDLEEGGDRGLTTAKHVTCHM